ncbi:MAG TPA: cysteine--tRNA ligase [Patescibacteria group bacterium]|nr:cysteine--tRNA ligase [Patescibacteria group bacterium]
MLKIYNTLSRKLESFKPISPPRVNLYSCGPTVYNYAHIGNLRAFIFVDLLKRYLEYSNFQVKHVMNITDVDDKTIKASKENKKPLNEFTTFYLKAILNDFKTLNIKEPDIVPRATENINEMVDLILIMIKKGYAYKKDGSIYFKISNFSSYGQLANLEQQNLKQNASGRLSSDEYQKEEVNDFVLWKAWRKEDGNVYWDTKIGRGRPGWHIECSAMAMKYLGETIDIHTGGVDLIFPHHTNEIAQSEAVTGKKFVKYWLHNAFLTVNKERMSKSLGNFYTLKDVIDKGYAPLLIRIVFLKTHYRSMLDFSFEELEDAKNIVMKFVNFLSELESIVSQSKNNPKINSVIDHAHEDFCIAMNEDLNISKALAVVFDFMNQINKSVSVLNKEQAKNILDFIIKIDSVFGFIDIFYSQYKKELKKITEKQFINNLIEKRKRARQERNFRLADKLKNKLLKEGLMVRDKRDSCDLSLAKFL